MTAEAETWDDPDELDDDGDGDDEHMLTSMGGLTLVLPVGVSAVVIPLLMVYTPPSVTHRDRVVARRRTGYRRLIAVDRYSHVVS